MCSVPRIEGGQVASGLLQFAVAFVVRNENSPNLFDFLVTPCESRRRGCDTALDMTIGSYDFRSLRQWRGSQNQAFEELCYQLRDPTPDGTELFKTGSPDGGLEWYVNFRNGVQWGWQAKFTFDIDTLLTLMERSLKTVVEKRPKCRRLTFCIPFDLPDAPGNGQRKSARQKFEGRKKRWRDRIPGANRVRIALWSEGELLERLVGHPSQRGMEWFFWDREVFSPKWCAQRVEKTVQEAGERYSPELHVDLPIAFALEGLALSEAYRQRFRTLRGAVVKASSRIEISRYTGIGVTTQLRNLVRSLAEWQHKVPTCMKLPKRLDPAPLLHLTHTCYDAANAAYPHDPPREQQGKETKHQTHTYLHSSLQHDLDRLTRALQDFEDLLQSSATEAAFHSALLLTGEAGQGKTHLFCDAAKRAVDTGWPAIVILGGRLSGHHIWSEVAEQLGLGEIGSERLIGAMQAAAEASNAPFLLLLDALNDAAEPTAWQAELPSLLAEIAQNPWISLAVSVRSTFLPVVLPADGLSRIAKVEHPGFEGRELESTERFFDAFGLEQPRIPLLTPEFTNPLFLKLYCEGLKGLGLSAPPVGEDHISDVFERYLAWKETRIVSRLRLDPVTRPFEDAIDAFSEALAHENCDSLAHDRSAQIINNFAPKLHQWPDTLFGQLLNEGVLTTDVAWHADTTEPVNVIRFTYQRFADYRVGSALLKPLNCDPARLVEALAAGKPLQERLLKAPAGWIEALAVQIPERFNIELLDAAQWRMKTFTRRQWDRAFVRSIAARRPSAVTTRSRELLRKVQQRSPGLHKLVLETILAVAPCPGHPFNADWLHNVLKSWSMPTRDVAWSIPTYFAFDNGGVLDRLIRWSARGPYPDCPDEVIELVAVPLVWTFTSPNRRMRDYLTKALTQLLSGSLSVLPSLIRRFDGVNDPYVVERLAVVSHGAVLCGGGAAPKAAVAAAQELKRVALADAQVPNVITRDAVRGIYEWCARHDLIDKRTYAEVLPPYGAVPPVKPRTKKQLERAYDRGKYDRQGNYIRSPYGALFGSIFDMGDFGRYVVEPEVRQFTQYPLSQPRPAKRKVRVRRPDKRKLAELEATLSTDQVALKKKEPSRFVDSLNEQRQRLLLEALDPHPARDTKATYPAELAQRWIFERVLALGWTPERFDDFERTYLRDWGYSAHRGERFGKKYQWIALRELVARIADNFHIDRMTNGFEDQLVTYEEPWQFFGRDIDPTLPPPLRKRNEDGSFELSAKFASDDEVWWTPPGPSYRRDDPPVGEGWAVGTDDIPQFEPLVRRKDRSGTRWVVLHAYYHWDDEVSEDEESHSRRSRHLWSHIYSWLVQPADRNALVSYLERHSLFGRWMPEGCGHTDAAYLGELPWAKVANEYPDSWRKIPQSDDLAAPMELQVYPTWAEYLWEVSALDRSIEDSVHAWFPAPVLFEAGELSWVPGTCEWCKRDGPPVAQYREGSSHSALLVREDWLKRTLRKTGHSIVFGWLGEKRLLGADFRGIVGDWTQIDAIASLVDKKWSFGKRRLKRCSVSK